MKGQSSLSRLIHASSKSRLWLALGEGKLKKLSRISIGQPVCHQKGLRKERKSLNLKWITLSSSVVMKAVMNVIHLNLITMNTPLARDFKGRDRRQEADSFADQMNYSIVDLATG